MERTARGALWVAAGIFASRVAGLVRSRVVAHYLGNSVGAAALNAATRIPNILQNLLGEGVLSASFIPVYAQALGKGDQDGADRIAGAVFSALALVVTVMVAVGMLAAPLLVKLLIFGLDPEVQALTVELTRVLFPGTGLLVFSAWCLGVLNSHRRFFLSYVAPVVWNGAIIAALLLSGSWAVDRLAQWAAYGAVVGAFLQFAVQVPGVLRVLGRFRPRLPLGDPDVAQVGRAFGPALVGRGVVQISAWVDMTLTSLTTTRAFAALGYAQTLYLVPVSLFGMAVSAAELPELSRDAGEGRTAVLRERLERGLERVSFFVVPSAVAFVAIGDLLAAGLLQTGRFDAAESRFTWLLLASAAVGLVPSTLGRLYASTFYALKAPEVPLRMAVVRIAVGASLATLGVLGMPRWFGTSGDVTAVAVPLASGFGAWVECSLLRRRLVGALGAVEASLRARLKLWGSACVAGAAAVLAKLGLTGVFGATALPAESLPALLPPPAMSSILAAGVAAGAFGATYLLVAGALGVPQVTPLLRRLTRGRLPRRSAE